MYVIVDWGVVEFLLKSDDGTRSPNHWIVNAQTRRRFSVSFPTKPCLRKDVFQVGLDRRRIGSKYGSIRMVG